MNKSDHENRIQEVAYEILKYMDERPNAAETVEGIANWWISRQRIEESLEIVEAALEYLVSQKRIVKRNIGGRTLYMREK